MAKLCTCLLIVLLLSVPAYAQETTAKDKTYAASRITLYSSLAFDIATTERGIHYGAREGNPLAGQNPWQRNAVAIGGTVVADLASCSLHRNGHTKAAKIMNFVVSSVHFTMGGFNLRFGP